MKSAQEAYEELQEEAQQRNILNAGALMSTVEEGFVTGDSETPHSASGITAGTPPTMPLPAESD